MKQVETNESTFDFESSVETQPAPSTLDNSIQPKLNRHKVGRMKCYWFRSDGTPRIIIGP